MYIQNLSRNELAHPVMGTIFLVTGKKIQRLALSLCLARFMKQRIPEVVMVIYVLQLLCYSQSYVHVGVIK